MGKVDTIGLANFLRNIGFDPTEMELIAMIRRIDTDGDAAVSLSELEDFLRITGEVPKGVFANPPIPVNPQQRARRFD